MASADFAADLSPVAEPGEVADSVGLRLCGPMAVVTLSRPASHNALSFGSWLRIAQVFDELGGDRDLRAIVVRGAGERAFSAGANIEEFPALRMSAEAALDYNAAISNALEAVMGFELPTVAMVRGLAVGGGCELAAACDLRIAATDARFGIPIGRLGVTLGPSEARAIVRLIGPARLKDLLFTGRLVDASEALAIGLVNRVVPVEELAAATAAVVSAIVSSAPTTIRAGKLAADTSGRPLSHRDEDVLARLTREAYDGADLKEGVAAFLERRPPRFGRLATEEG
jgi:enoyl-CoA hydratase